MEPGSLRWKTPAELIAWVTSVGLADVSAYTTEELKMMGWFDNPVVDRLYELNSAGVWTPRTNASGQLTEANSASLMDNAAAADKWLMAISPPSVARSNAFGILTAVAQNLRRGAGILHFATDGAGVAAAQPLYTGPASYYPLVRLKRLISDVADAATTLQRTVTGGALVGGANRVVAIVANVSLDLGDELLYNLTDASAINLAIDAGPVSAHIYLEYEYWSET